MAVLALVMSTDGDWEQLYVEGELIEDGHSIPSTRWIKIMARYMPASSGVIIEKPPEWFEDDNELSYEDYDV